MSRKKFTKLGVPYFADPTAPAIPPDPGRQAIDPLWVLATVAKREREALEWLSSLPSGSKFTYFGQLVEFLAVGPRSKLAGETRIIGRHLDGPRAGKRLTGIRAGSFYQNAEPVPPKTE